MRTARWAIMIATAAAAAASCSGSAETTSTAGPSGASDASTEVSPEGAPAGSSGAAGSGANAGASGTAGTSGTAGASASSGNAGSGAAGTGGAAASSGSAGAAQACCGPGKPCSCPPNPDAGAGGAGGCYMACAGDVCKFDMPVGGCWTSYDCGLRTCQGAVVCPCGAQCAEMDQPGKCVPPGGCCQKDDECGDAGSARCVGNVCHAATGCWLDSDCTMNKTCLGELLCPCGQPCYTAEHPGACGCCASASDCPDTIKWVCSSGRCLDRTIPTGCWNDAMCPPPGKCTGAIICPCGAVCGIADTPGTCT
jgi:hypothetical protein